MAQNVALSTAARFRLKPSDPFVNRLKVIHNSIVEVIRKLQPEAAAFESLFYSSNVQSALKLGHVRGVSMFAAAEENLPVFEYSPLEVKSAVTGYGRAEKLQVQQMFEFCSGLETAPEPYDASDALAVAICCTCSFFCAAVAGNGTLHFQGRIFEDRKISSAAGKH